MVSSRSNTKLEEIWIDDDNDCGDCDSNDCDDEDAKMKTMVIIVIVEMMIVRRVARNFRGQGSNP